MKKNRISRKWFIALILCIISMLLFCSYFIFIQFNKKTEKKNYSIVYLYKGNLKKSVETTGEVVAKLEVEIKCKASGEIIKMPVDISDKVKKGELLLQLDPEDEETSVKQAEVALASSKASFEGSKIKLEYAEATLKAEKIRALNALKYVQTKEKEYTSRLGRAKSLREKDVISEADYETVISEHSDVKDELATAQAKVLNIRNLELDVQLKQHDIEIAKAKVDLDALDLKLAKQKLAYTTVTAPMDGIVSTKDVQVGQIITSGIDDSEGTAVMTLIDISEMYVLAYVDESNIGDIKIGQKANITVDAYPEKKFTGEVVRIATTGVVESDVVRYEVKIKVDKKNLELLKPMMTANVEIIIQEKNQILILPVNAVYRQGNKKFVKILNLLGNEKVCFVKTGISGSGNIEIISGINTKDKIILPEKENNSNWTKNKRKPHGPSMGTMMP